MVNVHGGRDWSAATRDSSYVLTTADANTFTLANPTNGATVALSGTGNDAQYFTTSITNGRTFVIPTGGVTTGAETMKSR